MFGVPHGCNTQRQRDRVIQRSGQIYQSPERRPRSIPITRPASRVAFRALLAAREGGARFSLRPCYRYIPWEIRRWLRAAINRSRPPGYDRAHVVDTGMRHVDKRLGDWSHLFITYARQRSFLRGHLLSTICCIIYYALHNLLFM